MATDPVISVAATDWSDVAYQLAAGVTKWVTEAKSANGLIATLAEKEGVVRGMAFDLGVETALAGGELLHKVEGALLPVLAAFVAPTVSGMFGAAVDEALFTRRIASGGGQAAGQGIVAGFMKAIEGGAGGELAPSPEGAARIASAAVAAALEGIFNGLATEMLSDLLPAGFGHFEGITELPEEILRTLGVSRLVRRAIGPLVTVCCTTPMQWHVNKRHTPTLLTSGDTVRQVLRGRWSKERGAEELARQGYHADRIEALLNAGAKFFSVADVQTFEARGHWSHEKAVGHLRDQGYTQDGALDALRLEGLHRFITLEGQEAAAIVGAYAARDIDDPTFAQLLGDAVTPDTERALWSELARVRRAVNIKRLSLPQVESMVKAGVLAVTDYRETAEREGYPAEDVIALELLLRFQLDRDKSVADHRRELDAERAAAKDARAAELAAKRAAVDAERAIKRRGATSDLARAAVRGLVDLATLEQVYRLHYDDDVAAVMLELVEAERADYVAQQTARADAVKRAGRRGVDVGALESAVAEHVLTLPEFSRRLAGLGFSGDDVQVLTATLEAKLADVAAAKATRDAAATAAAVKRIDLAKYEQLVRRGVHSLAEYDALLASLGFDVGSRADLAALLKAQITDDAKARALREATAAAAPARGVTLEQVRRGVVLGITTEDQFQAFLIEAGYTTDAQLLLLAEVRDDVAKAELARRTRAAADGAPQARNVPVSTVRRAARLGLIPVAAYQARLERDGYDAGDVALEIDLLLLEMQNDAPPAAPGAPPAAVAAARGLSLGDLARAVKLGTATIDAYQSRAIELGYTPAAAATLAATLSAELATLAAARRRHDEIGLALAADGISLADLDAAVLAGTVTLAAYVAQLDTWGYASDDGEILAALLALKLVSA